MKGLQEELMCGKYVSNYILLVMCKHEKLVVRTFALYDYNSSMLRLPLLLNLK